MESNLVAEFVAQTGADAGVAHTFLQAKGWNLKLAVQAYLYLPDDTSTCWSVPEENGNVTEPRHTLSSRPVIQSSDESAKKLTRGISRATENINLVSRARSDIAHDFREKTVYNLHHYFIETPVFTFTLPDLTIYPEDFRGFLEKDLIETSSLISLEQAGRLNWWADSGACQRLWPLATTGDGNCLLHAASLGMWGFHDRLLTLRKALHGFLTSSECKEALWRRWRWQQAKINALSGFVYTEDEWLKEWSNIVELASTAPRKLGGRRRSILAERNLEDVSENATYESLEEIHVLALAHVLRRAIIVIADLMLKDVNGEDLAPIPFGGIYLPLECMPSDCHRSPLVLTYDAAHFSALVVMDKETFVDKLPQPSAVIPLTNSEHELLPIQFSVDPGKNFNWDKDALAITAYEKLELTPSQQLGLLGKYLDIVRVPIPTTPGTDDGDVEAESCSVNFANDEEDIEKKFSEVLETNVNEDGQTSDSGLFAGNRSKAAKQLQSVAKQFGSIGKSMSKKLKKNLGSITKITRTNSQKKSVPTSPVRQTTRLNSNLVSRSQDYILCAQIHIEKRHEFQEEMVRNYLQSARIRFQRDKVLKQKQAEERRQKDELKLKELARLEGPSNCINPECDQYGTAITSYMCKECFEKQRDQELSSNINSPSPLHGTLDGNTESDLSTILDDPYAPRYGAGKSRFYTEADPISHSVVSKLPSSKAGSNIDQTLYLSKSTFYNDTSGIINPLDTTLNIAKSVKETIRLTEQEPSFGFCPSPNGTWQEEMNSRLATKNGTTNETSLSKVHSYNLVKSWDESKISEPNKVDSSHSAGHSSHAYKPESSYQPLRSSASTGSRNVSVATLSPLTANELPNVERVTAGQRTSVGVWVPCSGAYPCRTNNCKFFGNPECDYYCSKCFKDVVHPGLKSFHVQEVKR